MNPFRIHEYFNKAKAKISPLKSDLDYSCLLKTEVLSTVMHEVQHAIQRIEGFAGGASIRYWEKIADSIPQLENAIKSKEQEILRNYGADMLQLAKRYIALFDGVYDRNAVPTEFKKEKRAIEKTADERKCGGLFRMLRNHHLELRRNEYKLATFKDAGDLYRNTAGEIEARDVAARLNKNTAEREDTRPDIDRDDVAFTEDEFYNFGKKNKPDVKSARSNPEMVAERARSEGYSEKLYHQTGEDFTVFDTEHQKAGKYDPEMPTGTFLKPDDRDIGLSGKKQMELYTKIKNPLEFKDRADAQRFWMRNIEGYAEALRVIDRINERYSREVARAGVEVSEYKKEWRRNNPDANSRDIYNDAEFQRLDEAQDQIAREWDDRSNEASLEAKKLIDGYMMQSGYDGVVVESDVGSNGRATKTYVVFDSSQMKSTDTVTYDDNGNEIPVSARFDSSKKDIRYSLPENKNTVADKTNSDIRLIVDKLNNNESISIDDIENASQIKKLLEEAFAQPETDKINTQERIELRNTIANKLLNNGSAILDSNGKVRYNGIVKREKRVDIVIGLSAAGKSSVLVNPLSQFYSSRIIDSDMAKEELPEFNNGIGANAVHKESKRIIDSVYDQSLANGDNIVYPIVGGGDPTKLTERIKQLKELGYSVFLHLNELPNNKAIARSLNRYLEEGRFIPPRVIYNYGDTPTQNFNDIINMEGLIDGYSHYSNDVERGKPPQLVKISENVREFDGREPSWRSHTGRKSEENAQGDGNRRVSYSLPEKDSVRQVADAYRDGTIDFDEYNSRINDLFTQAGEESGTIKPGEIVEPPNKRVPTPKSVSDGTKVRQFARTILESGYATPEMEAYLKELILNGDFSYTPTRETGGRFSCLLFNNRQPLTYVYM